MATDKISSIYAKALLELAQSEGRIEEIESEISLLEGVFGADPSIWSFFKSPLFGLDEKKKVLDVSLKRVVSETVFNFLGVLSDRRRFDSFSEIVETYSHLANEILGRTGVAVRSAVELNENQLESLRKELERYLAKKVVFDYKRDPDLLGGIVVKSGDIMMDTSIKSSLETIRHGLLSRKILGEEYYENKN